MSLPPQSNTRKIGNLLRKGEAGFSYGGDAYCFQGWGERIFTFIPPRPMSSSALASPTHPY